MTARGYDRAKRALDVAIAVPLFVLTLPFQVATALLIRSRLGSPVIFRQRRPGLHGEPFEMVKFRTMLDIDPALGLVDDASRMTPVGRWLRATSIDELPTLWNVIRGDMSIVGPRPLLLEYLSLYTPGQQRRHDVRPGLTGLAQVRGRNAVPWAERFALDVWYVDHRSTLLDLRIITATVTTVLKRRGVTEPGSATMTPFVVTTKDEGG